MESFDAAFAEHNEKARLLGLEPVKIGNAKKIYVGGYKRSNPSDRAMARLDAYLRGLLPPDALPGQGEPAHRNAEYSLASAVEPDPDACEKLAEEYFGNKEIGAEIGFKLTIAAKMHRGAEARRRPAIRRDKLEATAKVVRKLQAGLGEFRLAAGHRRPWPDTARRFCWPA